MTNASLANVSNICLLSSLPPMLYKHHLNTQTKPCSLYWKKQNKTVHTLTTINVDIRCSTALIIYISFHSLLIFPKREPNHGILKEIPCIRASGSPRQILSLGYYLCGASQFLPMSMWISSRFAGFLTLPKGRWIELRVTVRMFLHMASQTGCVLISYPVFPGLALDPPQSLK